MKDYCPLIHMSTVFCQSCANSRCPLLQLQKQVEELKEQIRALDRRIKSPEGTAIKGRS